MTLKGMALGGGKIVRRLVVLLLLGAAVLPIESAPSAAGSAVPRLSPPGPPLGYRMVAADGGVFAFGDAGFFGSMAGAPLRAPVVGMVATHSGRGYWLVAADGGLFAFGDAGFFGSMVGRRLNGRVVGMAATSSSRGYWLVAADGGVFAFGDAPFLGSAVGLPLNRPVVGMSRTFAGGSGYHLAAADGGVFAFGDAEFRGSLSNDPSVTVTDVDSFVQFGPDSLFGYVLLSSRGLMTFFARGMEARCLPRPAPPAPFVGAAYDYHGDGYWMVTSTGHLEICNSAAHLGSLSGRRLAAPVVGITAAFASF